jgi:hypothetical protein
MTNEKPGGIHGAGMAERFRLLSTELEEARARVRALEVELRRMAADLEKFQGRLLDAASEFGQEALAASPRVVADPFPLEELGPLEPGQLREAAQALLDQAAQVDGVRAKVFRVRGLGERLEPLR